MGKQTMTDINIQTEKKPMDGWGTGVSEEFNMRLYSCINSLHIHMH